MTEEVQESWMYGDPSQILDRRRAEEKRCAAKKELDEKIRRRNKRRRIVKLVGEVMKGSKR